MVAGLNFSSKSRSEQSLARWATPQLHDIDALAKMVDPALRGLYPPKSLSRFADVIALCVQVREKLRLFSDSCVRCRPHHLRLLWQSEPEFRPPISEVVPALLRCVQRTSLSKRGGGDLGASRRSDDSD